MTNYNQFISLIDSRSLSLIASCLSVIRVVLYWLIFSIATIVFSPIFLVEQTQFWATAIGKRFVCFHLLRRHTMASKLFSKFDACECVSTCRRYKHGYSLHFYEYMELCFHNAVCELYCEEHLNDAIRDSVFHNCLFFIYLFFFYPILPIYRIRRAKFRQN